MAAWTERWYRRLLLAYPSGYRHQFGDEMLDVLMEAAENPAGPRDRPRLGETWALLWHGLGMRLGLRGRPGIWSRPSAAAAAVLATVLAVLGAQDLIRNGTGTTASLSPETIWSAAGPGTGPAVLGLLCVGLLVLGRSVLSTIAAWTMVTITCWQSRILFDSLGGWGTPPADSVLAGMDEAASAVGQAQQLALLVPGVVLALLLSRPGVAARAVPVVGHTTVARALTGGLLMAVWADRGMSQIWAPIMVGVLMLPALVRASVLLRTGLLVTFGFGYLLIAGFADGSGSQLPTTGPLLLTWMGLLPPVAFLGCVLAINRVDASASFRLAVAQRLEAFSRTLTDREPRP